MFLALHPSRSLAAIFTSRYFDDHSAHAVLLIQYALPYRKKGTACAEWPYVISKVPRSERAPKIRERWMQLFDGHTDCKYITMILCRLHAMSVHSKFTQLLAYLPHRRRPPKWISGHRSPPRIWQMTVTVTTYSRSWQIPTRFLSRNIVIFIPWWPWWRICNQQNIITSHSLHIIITEHNNVI